MRNIKGPVRDEGAKFDYGTVSRYINRDSGWQKIFKVIPYKDPYIDRTDKHNFRVGDEIIHKTQGRVRTVIHPDNFKKVWGGKSLSSRAVAVRENSATLNKGNVTCILGTDSWELVKRDPPRSEILFNTITGEKIAPTPPKFDIGSSVVFGGPIVRNIQDPKWDRILDHKGERLIVQSDQRSKFGWRLQVSTVLGRDLGFHHENIFKKWQEPVQEEPKNFEGTQFLAGHGERVFGEGRGGPCEKCESRSTLWSSVNRVMVCSSCGHEAETAVFPLNTYYAPGDRILDPAERHIDVAYNEEDQAELLSYE